MNLCAECGKRQARGGQIAWRPELCAVCAQAEKHPSRRGCEWQSEPDAARAANQMLAELRVYEIPAAWLVRAAEHTAARVELP